MKGSDSSGISETDESSHRCVSDGDSSSLTQQRPTGGWSRRRCHTRWQRLRDLLSSKKKINHLINNG